MARLSIYGAMVEILHVRLVGDAIGVFDEVNGRSRLRRFERSPIGGLGDPDDLEGAS